MSDRPADKVHSEREFPGQDEFEKPDSVFPTVGSVDGSLDTRVQDGRVTMRAEKDAELTLGIPNAGITDPTPAGSINATIDDLAEHPDAQHTYAEFAFESLDDLRQLRDALTAAIEYREEYVDD